MVDNTISKVIDALLELGLKGCYICDGFGHCAEECPTAKIIRKLFGSKEIKSNKLRHYVTVAIAT